MMLDIHFPRPLTKEVDPSLSGQERQQSVIKDERSTARTPREDERSTARIPRIPPRRTKRDCQSQQETETAYWDSLSKVWLTRRALDELNRRNRKRSSPIRNVNVRRLDLDKEADLLKDPPGQLKCFARYGGPDLRDIRGYPEPPSRNSTAFVMPSDQTRSRTQSKTGNTLGDSNAKTTTSQQTKNTSPYDPNFEQKLIDNGIFPDDYDFPDGRAPPKPKNWNDIYERLNQPRLSISPSSFSDEAFHNFKRTNSRALNEAAVMGDVFPIIQGTTRIPSAKALTLRNLEPLPHGNLVNASPDFYDGVRPAQIDLRIRQELESYIIPSTQALAPALPNFFVEAKGPNGTPAVAQRQAWHNGAMGARGVHELRSFAAEDSDTLYDNNAYTLTATYHNSTLNVYSIHPSPSTNPEISREYHMTHLGGWNLTGSPEQFRQGTNAFRNARDWAKTQRDEQIAAANCRVTGTPAETSTFQPSTQFTMDPDAPESETSADELS